MAIKKSDLYSSLWASCDELRGGMDASQYKDYVLFMLFIKYVSDKYGDYDGFEPPVIIPKGAGFKDMIALKGNSDIGNLINTQVIQPLIDANSRLARSDFPDFNDTNKLGDGAQKVEKLGNLIAIFENPALDFSQNRAENDDTSPARAARARASSTLRPKSAASWPRSSASRRPTLSLPPLPTTPPAAPARCC
jgi:type I restriction enzyme M protein